MSTSIFDGCDESCGWIAAFAAALAYGSFGVPIKATAHIQVNSLVMQSYKTSVMFLTSWLVLFMGETARWTPWGLLSGLLWVSGGTSGIYGIRKAGIAIAVGTWASVMVAINFLWGILVFQEPIHNIWAALAAFFLLGLGLVGMSLYSAPTNKREEALENASPSQIDKSDEEETPFEILVDNNEEHQSMPGKGPVLFFGGRLILTRRQLGILAAALNGVLTGSSLIPLHYAKEQGYGGATYMISFASGALVSNILVWIMFFVVRLVQVGGVYAACQSMPEWHFRQLCLPGFLSGLLLTIAMFGSILAVTYLGQGVGNSLV